MIVGSTHGKASLVARCLGLGLALASGPAWAQAERKVVVRFSAQVGDQPFACGRSYDGIGATRSRVTPSDFRFYVSDVALIDFSGEAVPLALDQDERWQHRNVALLDFEDRTGSCLTGTQETRDIVTGAVPAGSYRGLHDTGRFRTPSLRNVALTAPYMHDGSIGRLEDVVLHYAAGGRARSRLTSPFLPGFALTDGETADLIAFLESLTDERFIADPRFSDPWLESARVREP